MARRDISMSDSEIHRFLTSQSGAIVVANSIDGGATGTIAPFQLREQAIVLSMSSDNGVVAALRVDDRVCVTVEQYPSYREIRAVIVHGRATILESATDSVEVLVPLGDDIVSFDFSKSSMPSDRVAQWIKGVLCEDRRAQLLHAPERIERSLVRIEAAISFVARGLE